MIDQKRAVQLLGNGLGPTEVGTALGCDPSFISQLLMDEVIRQEVMVLRMQNLQASTERDLKIDDLEDIMLKKLKELVPYMTNVREMLAAFNIFNAAKRRGARAAGEIDGGQKIVALVLPPAARLVFTTNTAGEVVDVGGQVTITKPLAQLMQERTLKMRKDSAQDAQLSNGTTQASFGSAGKQGAKVAA